MHVPACHLGRLSFLIGCSSPAGPSHPQVAATSFVPALGNYLEHNSNQDSIEESMLIRSTPSMEFLFVSLHVHVASVLLSCNNPSRTSDCMSNWVKRPALGISSRSPNSSPGGSSFVLGSCRTHVFIYAHEPSLGHKPSLGSDTKNIPLNQPDSNLVRQLATLGTNNIAKDFRAADSGQNTHIIIPVFHPNRQVLWLVENIWIVYVKY